MNQIEIVEKHPPASLCFLHFLKEDCEFCGKSYEEYKDTVTERLYLAEKFGSSGWFCCGSDECVERMIVVARVWNGR